MRSTRPWPSTSSSSSTSLSPANPASLCNYIKIHRQFFMQGLSAIDKLMPDVEKANNMVKGLKAKYEKKKATPGGFDTRTGDKAKKKLLFGRPLGDVSLAPVEHAVKYIQSRGLTTQGAHLADTPRHLPRKRRPAPRGGSEGAG